MSTHVVPGHSDLFGAVPMAPTKSEPTSATSSKPRAARRARTLENSTVVTKAAVAHSSAPLLFPELIAADFKLTVRDSSLDDDDDDPGFGPRATVTDAELRQELAAWNPSDREAADFLWRLQVAHLEEELAFLGSPDPKPRVSMEKAHILQWIFTEDVVGSLDFRKEPMSFHSCCKASNIDPEKLRESLLQVELVRSLLLNLRMCKSLPPLARPRFYADIVGAENVPDAMVYQHAGM